MRNAEMKQKIGEKEEELRILHEAAKAHIAAITWTRGALQRIIETIMNFVTVDSWLLVYLYDRPNDELIPTASKR